MSSSESASPPPSGPRDAAMEELRRGARLADLLRRQVELIPELDCRHAVVANVSEISMAMESSLSILQSEGEPSAPCYSDGSGGARNAAVVVVAPRRKVRYRRGKHGEELQMKEIQSESPHSDGFHWRKYGEKKIRNAEHPRLYYKCGYSDDHKCPAKKYVQQQDGSSDSPQFIVTLVNEHTCATLFPDGPSSSSSSALQVLDFTKASVSSPSLMAAATPELKEEEEDIVSVPSAHSHTHNLYLSSSLPSTSVNGDNQEGFLLGPGW